MAAAPLASQPLQSDLAAEVKPDLESSASPDLSVAETIEANVDDIAQARANVPVADEAKEALLVQWKTIVAVEAPFALDGAASPTGYQG